MPLFSPLDFIPSLTLHLPISCYLMSTCVSLCRNLISYKREGISSEPNNVSSMPRNKTTGFKILNLILHQCLTNSTYSHLPPFFLKMSRAGQTNNNKPPLCDKSTVNKDKEMSRINHPITFLAFIP